jgi:hypothetical protein
MMMSNAQHQPAPLPKTWQDPIVQEIHALREQMLAQYKGDMHSYTVACVACTQALGFQFKTLDDMKESLPMK